MKLPSEFISGNEIPVDRATISRERMEEILFDYDFELNQKLAALTEDYKDLESKVEAIGAGGVSLISEQTDYKSLYHSEQKLRLEAEACADMLRGTQQDADKVDALCDSNYLAGAKEGWNLAAAGDSEGFQRLFESRRGYLKPIRDAQPGPAMAAKSSACPIISMQEYVNSAVSEGMEKVLADRIMAAMRDATDLGYFSEKVDPTMAEPARYQRLSSWTLGGIESLCISLDIHQEQTGGGSKSCAVAASILRGIAEQHFVDPAMMSSENAELGQARHNSAHAETERERITALAYWLDKQTFSPEMLGCAAASLRALLTRVDPAMAGGDLTDKEITKISYDHLHPYLDGDELYIEGRVDFARALLKRVQPASGEDDEELRRFLDVAASEGYVFDKVDAGDLYARLFPKHYADCAGNESP